MHSLSPEYIAKLRFNARQLAMLRTLGEQRGRQPLHIAQLPEVLNDVRRVAIADSIESSRQRQKCQVAAHAEQVRKGCTVDDVFQFRNQLVERYSNFSRTVAAHIRRLAARSWLADGAPMAHTGVK